MDQALLIDVPTAARRLNCSASWLHKQVSANLVQCTRLGRKVRFSEQDLEAFIASRRQQAAAPARRRVSA